MYTLEIKWDGSQFCMKSIQKIFLQQPQYASQHPQSQRLQLQLQFKTMDGLMCLWISYECFYGSWLEWVCPLYKHQANTLGCHRMTWMNLNWPNTHLGRRGMVTLLLNPIQPEDQQISSREQASSGIHIYEKKMTSFITKCSRLLWYNVATT